MSRPEPFAVHIGEAVLEDLRQRLSRCRFPDEAPDSRWKYGADLQYLRSLVEYWLRGYDWRKHEAVLNRFRQYKVRIAGIDLHFIHEEGKGREPMPLLVSHGWPGSVSELLTIYTIVNALTVNLPTIKSVQLLVEGKEVDTLAGHIDLRQPIAQNPDLIH